MDTSRVWGTEIELLQAPATGTTWVFQNLIDGQNPPPPQQCMYLHPQACSHA